MLYKKIHRQYLREFKRGRKFKIRNINCKGKVYEVTKEPIIGRVAIWIDGMDLISFYSGKIRYKDEFKWID